MDFEISCTYQDEKLLKSNTRFFSGVFRKFSRGFINQPSDSQYYWEIKEIAYESNEKMKNQGRFFFLNVLL